MESLDFESQDAGDTFTFGTVDESTLLNSPHREDDAASLSGSAQHSSGPDEEVFDSPSRHSSPRTSNDSSELSDHEDSWLSEKQPSSPYTPLKARSPFRNPSSVRAMQTDITPPRMSSSLPRSRHSYFSLSRQGTPRSVHSHHSAARTPSKISPGKKVKKDYPLVLLHVTLLPLPTQYSPAVLESVLPATICDNWRLLQEKIAQTVLERGILIPHPREDYDLLEERLLESLELKTPRILKCGHFYLSPEEEAEAQDLDHSDDELDAQDPDVCQDCGRRIRDGRFGDAGTGSKRWDIKIFAANGLMRGGAWVAAWKEMERVDVEIMPWMEENMKRELEFRKEEEERLRLEQERATQEEGIAGLDDERLKEIYGQSYQDARKESPDDNTRESSWIDPPQQRPTRTPDSLSELLRKFLIVAAKDRRNIAIALLSIFVLILSMRPIQTSSSLPNAPHMAPQSTLDPPLPPMGTPVTASKALTESAPAIQTIPRNPPEAQSRDESAEEESLWTESAEQVVQEILGD